MKRENHPLRFCNFVTIRVIDNNPDDITMLQPFHNHVITDHVITMSQPCHNHVITIHNHVTAM